MNTFYFNGCEKRQLKLTTTTELTIELTIENHKFKEAVLIKFHILTFLALRLSFVLDTSQAYFLLIFNKSKPNSSVKTYIFKFKHS